MSTSTDIGLPDDPTAADLSNIRSKIKVVVFVDVLHCDKRSSSSGNVYPKKVVEAAIKRFSDKHRGGYFPIRSESSNGEMGTVGMGKAIMIGDTVQVRCVGFPPHMKEALRQGALLVSISGIGTVSYGVVQSNYELCDFYVVSNPVRQ